MSWAAYSIRSLSSVFLLVVFLHGTQSQANEAIVFKVLDKTVLDVRYNGKFGQFCGSGDSFDTQIAGAVCQQMGMKLKEIYIVSVPPTQITIYKVKCTTTTLDSCNFTPSQGSDTCPTHTNLGTQTSSSVALKCHDITNVHLISTGSDHHSGVVEVVRGAERDVVCYDSAKSVNVANVVCKQMGYIGGTATDTSKPAGYLGKSLDISCTSGSANLDGCLVNAVTSGCNTILHVHCTLTNSSQITFDVRLSQSSNVMAGATSGTVEVFQYGKWGVICDTGWDINDANVVCRQLGFKEALGFSTDAKFGQGTGTVFWNNMQCSGDEQSIAECKHGEVFGTGLCNSVNASGVICSNETWPTIDCSTTSEKELQVGVSFVQSTSDFDYSTVCKVKLTSPTHFTVYIQQKMFTNNHLEYLSFISKDRNETIYGDNSTPGPMNFDTDVLTIEFMPNGAAGKGKFNIMVTVPEPPFTLTPTQETTSSGTMSTTTSNSSSANTFNQVVPPEPVNVGVIVGATVGVVCLLVLGILVFVLWKRGVTCLGLKTRNPDGNGLYDETRVPNGAFTGGLTGNYVNVGSVYENVSEPVYVNTAFVADQAMEASRDSSEYENMGNIGFNQASIADNITASAEESTVKNQDTHANNSTGADGESQYAKLETLNRSEYADFRGLTAEQLKPI